MAQATQDLDRSLALQGLPGAWRTEVALRIRELEHRLRVVAEDRPTAPTPTPAVDETLAIETHTAAVTVHVREAAQPAVSPPPGVRAAHIEAAKVALHDAREALAEMGAWKRLRAWWTGTAVTAGWESVHDAEAELVDLEHEEAVRASLPRLLRWIQDVMPSGDQRKRYERQLTDFMDATKPLNRTVVRQASQDAIVANNEKHANLRDFRNLLTLVAASLAIMLAGLASWHALDVNFISLCGKPPASAQASGSTTTTTAQRQCLTGSDPKEPDVAEIELVGAIGGLLSIAFGLGSVEIPPSRYNPRPPQAALKPAAGAATGLIGVLLVQSNILIAPASTSESLLLGYAAVFGFAQQLFTQFVDKHAGKLLGEQDAAKAGDTKN